MSEKQENTKKKKHKRN